MKIKIDFVTNSSSTSFIFIGVELKLDKDVDDMTNRQKIKKIFPKMSKEDIKSNLEKIDFYGFGNINDIDIIVGSESGAPDDKTILLGEKYGIFDGNCPYSIETTELIKDIESLKKDIEKETNIKEEIKLYVCNALC